MDDNDIKTLPQVAAFLDGTRPVEFSLRINDWPISRYRTCVISPTSAEKLFAIPLLTFPDPSIVFAPNRRAICRWQRVVLLPTEPRPCSCFSAGLHEIKVYLDPLCAEPDHQSPKSPNEPTDPVSLSMSTPHQQPGPIHPPRCVRKNHRSISDVPGCPF